MADEVRISQALAIVGVRTDPPVRITQAVALVGIRTFPGVRVSQAVGIVGVRMGRPPCLTHEAYCWRIERRDGVVYRYTSHDQDLTLNGEVYAFCRSLNASAVQLSAELGETSNLDLSGMITDDMGISEADLWSGLLDGAYVQVWRAPWAGSTQPAMIGAGRLGSLQFGDAGWKFEVVSAGERLQERPLLTAVTPSCRFQFGDERCGVDLAEHTVVGSITNVPKPNVWTQAQRRVLRDDSRTEPAGFWELGTITITSGPNTGFITQVKSWDGVNMVLETAAPKIFQIGDAYQLVRGCPRSFEACQDFDNSINFGGFPHVRGYDDLVRTPGTDIE